MRSQPSDDLVRHMFAELGFITDSDIMVPVLRQAQKAASVSDITVLIEGETGTGKQVLARAIHRLDEKRRSHFFVTVHCSTITESLAESELFGHEKGAFSGAVSERKGLFQTAHGGTLFLDDVNDLPLSLQPKLLDCLQRSVIRPVGSDSEVPINVRIVSACNRPLLPLVRENRFRADLYHRLNVVKLSLPPLRERTQDLEALLLACARRHSGIYAGILGVEPELTQFLAGQAFSGNVRELEHGVQRALFAKVEGTTLGLTDWMAQQGNESTESHDWICDAANGISNAVFQMGLTYDQAVRQMEGKFLEMAVQGGRTRREIASRLRRSERALYYKLRSHGIRHHSAAE